MTARPRTRVDRLIRRGLIVPAAAFLGACSATTPTPLGPIPGERFAQAFEAAKDALRENHFDLARVDAARGIIETHPRSSAGLATPWIDHADSFAEAVEGAIHRDRRRASVRFVREQAVPPDEGDPSDPGESPQPFTIEVRVEVQRAYVPGRRAEATSIRMTSRSIDPALANEGLYPVARSPVREDEDLAARIVAAIRLKIPDSGGADQKPHSEPGIN
jgi:hypothetical protein